jgi:hypothetical protein
MDARILRVGSWELEENENKNWNASLREEKYF